MKDRLDRRTCRWPAGSRPGITMTPAARWIALTRDRDAHRHISAVKKGWNLPCREEKVTER